MPQPSAARLRESRAG